MDLKKTCNLLFNGVFANLQNFHHQDINLKEYVSTCSFRMSNPDILGLTWTSLLYTVLHIFAQVLFWVRKQDWVIIKISNQETLTDFHGK